MGNTDLGSLTKEPPLASLDATIRIAKPGMAYSRLLNLARTNRSAHRDAPGLISRRFILINQDDRISDDYFLALVESHGITSPIVRKVMYFVWAYRDMRIRSFICKRIADRSGRWRTEQLLNKRNAKFFEKWLKPRSAAKARSTFEFFLCESNIYDKQHDTIHLELDDGWLEYAAMVAAQHETNPNNRKALLADPIGFLKARNWLGLLNAARPTRRSTSPLQIIESSLVGDDAIRDMHRDQPRSREGNRKGPSAVRKGLATSTFDLVAHERANESHYELEKALARAAKRSGYRPKYTQNIDIYFDTPHGSVLAEVKSCVATNFHAQARKGISQLFEYRFLYAKALQRGPTLLLLMENEPPRRKAWLARYLSSLHVTLAWRDPKSKRIGTTSKIPPSLSKILIPL